MKKYLPNLMIIVGTLFMVISFGPFIKDEVWYYAKEKLFKDITQDSSSPFANLLKLNPIVISNEFNLYIEKIGVNVPVVKDVPVWDKDAYIEALKGGVAHASSSPYPSEDIGNVYIFAHASLNFFENGKYATEFNLLRKLEVGDEIIVTYKGKTYVYKTVNKEKVKGWNTYPLTRPVLGNILTLQTCDPPGSTINRLIVTANLVEIRD